LEKLSSPYSVINMGIRMFRLNVCSLQENVKSRSPYTAVAASQCLSSNCTRNKPAIASFPVLLHTDPIVSLYIDKYSVNNRSNIQYCTILQPCRGANIAHEYSRYPWTDRSGAGMTVRARDFALPQNNPERI
jgi:hypothetical protein